MKKIFFPELESLRGIASLLVLTFHFSYWNIFSRLSGVGHFDIFVDFFFVLSGFVIALNFSEVITNVASFKTYLTKRIFRLYPLFFVASVPFIAAAIAKTYFHISFIHARDFEIKNLLFYITLTYKWGFVDGLLFNFPSWSISVEFLLYIIAGLLFLLKRNQKVNIFICAVLVVAAFAILLSVPVSIDAIRGIFCFFLGVIVNYIFKIKNELRANEISSLNKNIFFIATFISLIVSFYFFDQNKFSAFTFPLLFAAFIYLLVTNKYPVYFQQFLNFKVVRYLGTISYSAYLMHPLMVQVVEKIFTKTRLQSTFLLSAFAYLIYLVLVLLVSTITYKFVEVPGKNLYQKFRFLKIEKTSALVVDEQAVVHVTKP